MRDFTTAEKARMRDMHASALMDTCVREMWASADDGYGYGGGHTDGATLDCQFSPTAQDEAAGQVPRIDGRLLFAWGTTLDHRDILRLTHLHGDAITAQRYNIVGGPVTTHVGVQVDVALVTE